MKRHVERVRPSDSLRLAAQKMREHNLGFLPVCDASDRVLGVLTDRDIVVRACALGLGLDTAVSSVMSTEVVACRPSDDVERVEELMTSARITRVVVTDPHGILIGLVSLSDLAQYEPAQRTAETLQQVTARKYDPSSGIG